MERYAFSYNTLKTNYLIRMVIISYIIQRIVTLCSISKIFNCIINVIISLIRKINNNLTSLLFKPICTRAGRVKLRFTIFLFLFIAIENVNDEFFMNKNRILLHKIKWLSYNRFINRLRTSK
jgi:hypothetical protein